MKPTQKQIEREAWKLLTVGGVNRTDGEMWKHQFVRDIWCRIACHVLRRIAAAERRGASKTHKREFNAFYKRWEAKKGTR